MTRRMLTDKLGNEEVEFAVREIYYDDDGGLSWTADPVYPTGETWMELADAMSRYTEGLGKPVLDIDTRTWLKPGRSADLR